MAATSGEYRLLPRPARALLLWVKWCSIANHYLMTRLIFTRGFQISQNRSTLRCPQSPPQMRSGRNIGPTVANFSNEALCLKPERGSWWRARRPMRNGFINVAHFMAVASQITLLDRLIAPFTQQRLRYQRHHGKGLLWAHFSRRGLALSLLQAQSCGNHSTWKRRGYALRYSLS